MAIIKELNDIEIYKKSLVLTQHIYQLTRLSSIKNDYSLIDQLRRASLSVSANIAEGYGRQSKKDFAHFLSISLGSTNEVMCYLDFISLEYKIEIHFLKNEYKDLSKRIHSFRSYLYSLAK